MMEKTHTPNAARCCGQCAHFCNAPAAIEAAFLGLTAMSSGNASVRAHDGLCDRHDLYLSYRDCCADFSAAGNVEVQRESCRALKR
jgi:hypothetical protein